MKLPNGNHADLGTKIKDYALNPRHREGRHKARIFLSTLGITTVNADLLRDAVLDAARTSSDAESRGDNGFGEVFVLRFPVKTITGSAIIVTAGIVRHGEDFPRLTTC